jgi:tetratricopeptide (TPR) repeat protein
MNLKTIIQKERINMTEKKQKLIVMPFIPEDDQEYNGLGLGIHFFLGNIMAIHTGLQEFWFGWRVKKLFPEIKLLKAYCQGDGPALDIIKLAEEQGIRYWLEGKYKQDKDLIILSLSLVDTGGKTHTKQLTANVNDGLENFSDMFFDWLSKCNLPVTKAQRAKALWPEKISIKGLEFLGDALETTYLSYIDPSSANDVADFKLFEKAVSVSPDSYLTHNLLAWALYKKQDYNSAIRSFKSAINYNKDGLGALSGLMWCALFTENKDNAFKYAIAKADVRQEDHEKAKAFVVKKLNLNL